jgi:hypothetical protein
MIFLNLVFALVWTILLAWLCNMGYKTISWFLVLLPYILMALAALGIYSITHEQKQMLRNIKLQGAYGQEALNMPVM